MSIKGSLRSRSLTSTPSSILKRPKTLVHRLSEIRNKPTEVKFELTKQLKCIFDGYVQKTESKEYEKLVIMIRDAKLTDADISSILKEINECISILDQKFRLFVEAILSIEWTSRGSEVIEEYQVFIVNLLSAHTYHAKMVIDKLVKLFFPGPDDSDWEDGVPADEDCAKCINVHALFNSLLSEVPMCQAIFVSSLYSHFPYYNKSTHIHEYYLHNLLWILEYRPNLRPEILNLIFSKLIIMDVNAPREEIEKYLNADEEMFLMDEETKSIKSSTTAFTQVNRHALAHTLDVCLDKIFNYFVSECHDSQTKEIIWEKAKNLYLEMLPIFDRLILPTYDIHHVQFIMFMMTCFKTTITEGFLNYLWKKVCNLNVAPVLRQAAVNYIASLVARSNFVPLAMIKGTLQQLAEWIHSYISSQDGFEYVNSDIRSHSVFYAVCQALFYIVAFRYKDFVQSKKNIVFLQSLNMAKMVTSRLNPLRVCQHAVVQNFAAVTRKYQLAYCYSVIEHNSRNTLPVIYLDEKGTTVTSDNTLNTFFPFDPFILERSAKKIEPFYKEYQEADESAETVMEETSEVDDFLLNEFPNSSKNKTQKFSYGSSPGFKFK
ncbi:unnamed protein product [Phyllotreta striolata]|uniref:RNA polymerase I-specific transcription initiation factor RRN3 n=1 Tax=Phyllotreta striolata TaxID=444603 RepID=A0A9P0GXM9_PHYSR|nr:unnamed protein product [Phyllotreta striolata]